VPGRIKGSGRAFSAWTVLFSALVPAAVLSHSTMTLTTVKVPQEMEPLFAQAEAVVSDYFARIKHNPAQGTIEIGGERYVLVRGAALSIEFFTLARNLFGPGHEAQADEFSRNILFDLAHAIGKSDAENFHARLNLTDPIAKLSAGPVHFAHSGWAFVDIFPESHPTPDRDFSIIYDHPYSFEADAWLKYGGQSEAPVCVMNAGYASGWCEASFGIPLVAVEMLCRAKGDAACRFIMAPPDRIAEHVERYVHQQPDLAPRMRSYGIPEFFARKRMEEELRRSEEQYRAIFNASAEALLIFNTEGNIVDANPSVEAISGYPREELIGKPGAVIFHPGYDYLTLFEDFKKQLMTTGNYHAELIGRHKNGTSILVEVRGSLFDYNGSPHLLALAQDITERKKAEEEVQKLASVVRWPPLTARSSSSTRPAAGCSASLPRTSAVTRFPTSFLRSGNSDFKTK
jgi:PAS domain S-box-containing protein